MRDPAASSHAGDWRRRLLDGLLFTALGLMTFALPVMVIQTKSYRRLDWTSLIVAIYLMVGWAAFNRRRSYHERAISLLFGLGSIALLGVFRVGFQAGPGIGAALVVVIAGLLLGRTALGLSYLLTTCALLGLGALHVHTAGRSIAPQANDPTLFSNWIRATFSYSLFTGVLAFAVMFVVAHMERSLRARTLALDELRSEQAQREQAEQALRAANEQIVQMQKLEAIGRLAGGVAHDFNNVLLVIMGWTDLLRSKLAQQPEHAPALDEITSAASRAGRLTQQLLAFGRKAVHVPQSVALGELVPKALNMLARLLPANVAIETRLSATAPAVHADPGQLHQLLVNLCLNARDAMPDGGTLEIVVEGVHHEPGEPAPAGDWVLLAVRDSGVGMSEETLGRAFEPFFTTKGELGNGLGLSSVYGIVQQSGGHVSVQSQLGKGTTFRVLLPPATERSSAPSPLPTSAAVAKRATILVAEDDPAVRLLISESLKLQGHVVVAADSGNAALELARRHRGAIDLLCTDGMMPGIDSAELIAGFRLLFPDAGVLVCSGHIEEQVLRDDVTRAHVLFLPKPFTSRELSVAVARALTWDDQ